MYQTSDSYKSKVYEPATRHLLKIFLDGTEVNKRDILDCKVSQILFSDNEFELGSVTSKAVELKLYKTAVPEKIREIYIESGIANEPVPVGYFNIEEINREDDYTVTLKLLDNMIKFEFNYDGSKLTYPCTILTVLKDICSKANVELGSNSFLNMNKRITVYDSAISAREYLSYISEQAGGFACIGRDGKLYIRTIGQDVAELPLKYFQNFNWGDKFKVSRVRYEDGIQLFEKGNTLDNTVYINQENIYIVDQEQIENVYEQLKELEVYSFEGDSIIDPAIDVGDLLLIDGKHVIYQGSVEYQGKFKASISSKIQSKQQEETTTRVPSQKVVNRKIQSQINQEELKITQLTQETTEHEERIAKAEQDLNGFKQNVENVVDYRREKEGFTHVNPEEAGATNTLQYKLQGNQIYENNLFPLDNLYLSEEVYPNQFVI